MIYFISWAVFLLGVVLAVPIVNYLEKRKHAPPKSTEKVGDTDDSVPDAAAVDEDDQPAEFSEDPIGDEVQLEAPGGDDFSAFDEDFK